MKKGFKALLNDVKVFINDEFVNEGMLEYLIDNIEIYNDDVQQFILKIDEDDFVDNVFMDIKENIIMKEKRKSINHKYEFILSQNIHRYWANKDITGITMALEFMLQDFNKLQNFNPQSEYLPKLKAFISECQNEIQLCNADTDEVEALIYSLIGKEFNYLSFKEHINNFYNLHLDFTFSYPKIIFGVGLHNVIAEFQETRIDSMGQTYFKITKIYTEWM